MLNVLEIQNHLKNYSDEQLAQEMRRPTGRAPQFLVLSELTRRKKTKEEFQQAQSKSTETTVADDVMPVAGIPAAAASMAGRNMAPNTDMTQNTGVGGPVQRMATGGIVALRRGGTVKKMQEGGTVVRDGVIYYTAPDGTILGTIEDLQSAGDFRQQFGQTPVGALPSDFSAADLANLQSRAQQQAADYALGAGSPMAAPTLGGMPPQLAPDTGVYQQGAPRLQTPSYDSAPASGGPAPAFTPADLANLQARTQQQAADYGFMASRPMPVPVGDRPAGIATYVPAPPQGGPPGMPTPSFQHTPPDTASIDTSTARPGGPNAGYAWQDTLRDALSSVHDIPTPRNLDDAMNILHGHERDPASPPVSAAPPVRGPAGMPVYPQAAPLPSPASRVWDAATQWWAGDEDAPAAEAPTSANTPADGASPAAGVPPEAGLPAAAPSGAPSGGARTGGGGTGGSGGIAALASSTTAEGSYGDELLGMLAAREKRATQDKWLALAQAGMALMSSRAPTLGRALGEAGTVGVSTLREGQASAEADRLQLLSMLEDWRMQQNALAMAASRGGGSGGSGGYGGSGGAPSLDWGLTAGQDRMLDYYQSQIEGLRTQEGLAETPEARQRIADQLAEYQFMADTLAASANPLYGLGVSAAPPEPPPDLVLEGAEEEDQ